MFFSTKEISEKDSNDLVKGALYCCIKDDGSNFIKVGTLSSDGIIIDELDTPYQYFSIWYFDLIYSSHWVDTLNDWGI